MTKDYYIVLGVSRSASPVQIKQAYRRIAKQFHPDISGSSMDAEKFIEIKEAYDTLGDFAKRRRYDTELELQGSPIRILRVPEMVRDRRRAYRDLERLGSFVDEFFDGLLPGFCSQRRYRSPQKDIYLEVILSSRESREGALLPVRFPVLEPCPQCSSLGFLDNFFCPCCYGGGSVSSEREFSLSIPPYTGHGTTVSLSLEDIGLRNVNLHVEVQVDPRLQD